MSSPASQRGREVRARLLAAAVELVAECGWTAVSTRVLATRAATSPSVVHYHFSSIQALLREAVVAAMRRALDDIDSELAAAQTAGEVVGYLLASVNEYAASDPMARVFVEAYLAASRDDALRVDIAEVLIGARNRVAQRLAAAGLPAAEDTAAVLLAAVDGLMLQRGVGAAPAPEHAAAVLHRLVATDHDGANHDQPAKRQPGLANEKD